MSESSQLAASSGFVECRLGVSVTTPASLVLQVAAARRSGLVLEERIEVVNNGVAVAAQEIVDPYGGRQHIIRAMAGPLAVSYNATVRRTDVVEPRLVTDAEGIAALRPSRYCPSERMAGFAQRLFGGLPTPMAQVRAIGTYVWEHVGYETTSSSLHDDAVETLVSGKGVCRDFAHLVAALCRAVNVPARVVSAYAPGLSPMDFHAVVETAIDGRWWVWDATRMAPRATLVRIGTGRDAADVAFLTVTAGLVEFSTVEVTAVASGDLPLDDHEHLVGLV